MKWIIITVAAAGIISLAFIKTQKKSVVQSNTKTEMKGEFSPVVVLELFTSEGCSSCPPADNLLPQLAKLDAAIIPLSFHVDYWNRLGWKDPFSSAQFSQRQKNYSREFNSESVYTPQLVVNGEYEMVGSNRSKAEFTIKKALKNNSRIKIVVEKVSLDQTKLKFNYQTEGEINNTNLAVAIVQKNAMTNVKKGENKGSFLTHTNVVRVFKMLETKQNAEDEMSFPPDLNADNWQLVLYIIQKQNLKISGATVYTPSK